MCYNVPWFDRFFQLEVLLMRTKRCVSLLLAAALALSLAGCGANGDNSKGKGGAMTIAPAQLSQEEQALADLLALGMEAYHIFDFQVEGAKSIHLRAYELADGEWNCAEHGVLEAAGGAGRVALTFGKMTEGVRMACKDASGVYSSEVTMAAGDDAASMTFATSTLTESAKIELDQEIPLAVRLPPRKMRSAPMRWATSTCPGSTLSTATSTCTPSP